MAAAPDSSPSGASESEVELVVVTLTFDAADIASLIAVLSKYVVLTRMESGCRNVDMVLSDTRPNRILVVEKWDSQESQQTHFNGSNMVDMAKSCAGLLVGAPDIDLWRSMSAHDLA
jgi:quinol monooxygenase YgiN